MGILGFDRARRTRTHVEAGEWLAEGRTGVQYADPGGHADRCADRGDHWLRAVEYPPEFGRHGERHDGLPDGIRHPRPHQPGAPLLGARGRNRGGGNRLRRAQGRTRWWGLGVLLFLTAFVFPLAAVPASAGLADDLGATFGLDANLFGGILGMALVIMVIIVLAMFDASGEVQMFSVIAVGAMAVVTGLWPTWVIIVLAIIGGILIFREITSD